MSITKNYLVDNTSFLILIDNTLTDLDRKVLTHLYLPIINDKALSIYLTMYTLVEPGSKESKTIYHHQLINMLGLKEDLFIEERHKLEAVGLLDVYFQNGMYIYVLKKVLSAYEFFENKTLVRILNTIIGDENLQNLAYEFLVRSIDLENFENITSSFDDVFEMINEEDVNYSSIGVNTKNNGIVIKNDKFNVEYFILLVEATDLFDKDFLYNADFLDLMKRYAFLYGLTVEQLKDALKNAVNFEKKLIYDDLDFWVRKIYDERNESKTFVAKKAVVKTNNRLINFLNTASPNDIVKAKYKTALTSTEIAMFDRVLKETNVSIGILNAAVLYVLVEKNGAIPSQNYFIKVINTWIRAGVNSVEDALNHINNNSLNKTTKSTAKNKTVKETPKWYNEQKNEENNACSQDNDLVDIVDFFKPNN